MFEGVLQYQCLDSDGLYTWTPKYVLIRSKIKILELFDIDGQGLKYGNPSTVSLQDLKYAKEWAIIGSQAGFGFDAVWHSGEIWSFIANSEEVCSKWVFHFNNIIHSTAEDFQSNESTKVDHYGTYNMLGLSTNLNSSTPFSGAIPNVNVPRATTNPRLDGRKLINSFVNPNISPISLYPSNSNSEKSSEGSDSSKENSPEAASNPFQSAINDTKINSAFPLTNDSSTAVSSLEQR